MDDALREKIRELAEARGLDLTLLEQALLSGDIPESLSRVMAEVLGELGRFEGLAGKLKK